MEKPSKRERYLLFTAAALVLIAWLCRFPDGQWLPPARAVRAVIYPVLYLIWGITLQRRLIHPQVRHLAVSLAALMFFWFAVRTAKYYFVPGLPDAERHLWYLYYLSMIFIPVTALLTALTVGLPETKRLPRAHNLLWFLGAALLILVLTNDLHQLIFVFPADAAVWSDDAYRYGPGYYVYAVFVVLCNAGTLIALTVKSRRPRGRGWLLLPCVPIALLLGYWAQYVVSVKPLSGWFKFWCGDLTAFTCVMYMAAFELCIRCGLIRSNTGYAELFRAGTLNAQITDKTGTVRLSAADAAALSPREIAEAQTHPVRIGTGLLKSKPIRFGHVLWREDVSELADAIEDYEENCRDLAERSRIDRERMNAEKALLSLQEKNRAMDLLRRETAGQIALIDSLLTRSDTETDEAERRKLLAGAAVVGAYVKRYGNLLLVSERSETAETADLTRCFEESFVNLELLGAECLCTLPALTMQTRDMLRIYRAYEAALEDCLFTLRQVWVSGREKNGQLVLSIEFVSDADLSRRAAQADAFSEDGDTARFTFRAEKGGAQR